MNEEFGLGLLDYGFRWYDPAIGRFTAVDPIAEKFAHVSTYNYAENSPIANIDLWGLQKYFAANGDFILQQGNDESMRIVNSQSTLECQNMSCEELQSNSALAYTEGDIENVFSDWSKQNTAKTSESGVEYGMSLFTKELTDGNGETIQVFLPGTTAKGQERTGGGSVNLLDSKLEIGGVGVSGWDRSSTIHTHPSGNALNFSGVESRGGLFGNDVSVGIRENIKIFLTTASDNRVGVFDPDVYNKNVVRAGDGYLYSAEHRTAAKSAIKTAFTLKK